MSMATPPKMMRRLVPLPLAPGRRVADVSPPVPVPLTSPSGIDVVTGGGVPPSAVVLGVASAGCVSSVTTGTGGPAGCGTEAAVVTVAAGGGGALASRAGAGFAAVAADVTVVDVGEWVVAVVALAGGAVATFGAGRVVPVVLL
jgi:hypothetical protein